MKKAQRAAPQALVAWGLLCVFYAPKSPGKTVVFLCHPGFGGTFIVPKKGGGCFCISGRKTEAFLPKTLRFYDAGISTVKMTRLS